MIIGLCKGEETKYLVTKSWCFYINCTFIQLAGPPSCRNIMYPYHAKTGLFMGAICVASSQKLYSLPRGFPQAVLFFSPASVVLGHVLKYGLPSPDPRVPTMNRSPHIG